MFQTTSFSSQFWLVPFVQIRISKHSLDSNFQWQFPLQVSSFFRRYFSSTISPCFLPLQFSNLSNVLVILYFNTVFFTNTNFYYISITDLSKFLLISRTFSLSSQNLSISSLVLVVFRYSAFPYLLSFVFTANFFPLCPFKSYYFT